jgi:hypothetical protein
MGFKIPARQGVFKKIEMVTVMVTGAIGAFEGHFSTGFIFRLYFIGL